MCIRDSINSGFICVRLPSYLFALASVFFLLFILNMSFDPFGVRNGYNPLIPFTPLIAFCVIGVLSAIWAGCAQASINKKTAKFLRELNETRLLPRGVIVVALTKTGWLRFSLSAGVQFPANMPQGYDIPTNDNHGDGPRIVAGSV
eukprot:TRINITY_DN8655_c0_g1_i1.p1 TRINITY_DN8655_c0_g1~~TRINITY_DN8655_c0_g1_i1.p1  ORF type:complete len:146 (-),score=7.16 TRINITY_DN8655_c0_g1_i1:170-607(-)